MITFGDIIEKPKTVLFPELRTDLFYQNCKVREIEIKKALKISFRSFNTHMLTFNKRKDELTPWEKKKIESCAENLTEYMEYLVNELDKDKIEKYCSIVNNMGDKLIPFLPDLVLIMVNSYQGAIETDLHWVTDLTIVDSLEISNGEFDFNKLERYLPTKITVIQTLCEELVQVTYVNSRLDSIKEALTSFENNHLKSSNLLLMTTIEGLVRSLGIFLVEKQALNVNPLNKWKYAALDNFINKISWKTDLQISDIKYGLLTGSYSLNKQNKSGIVSASLKERLGFLCRRFKENRNIILHGEETQYANSLNSFLNFSALKEVLLTIKEYQAIYNIK